MNRQSVNRSQIAALPLRQMLTLGMALLLTLAAGLFYYSWQTARLAEQVAAQTALLTQIQATRANTLVKAADPLPAGQATASRPPWKMSYHRTVGSSDLPIRTDSEKERRTTMLSWAITFLIIAIVAAVLGFGGIAGAATGIAKILFIVFLVLFVASFFFGRGRG